jgi:hypothetical protein
MAVARARLLAMADSMDAPPDSPRDDFVGEADVRLNKEVMAGVNAENDAAGADLSCVNLLRSVPTPRLLALEARAREPAHKADPQSQYLLRDIHWEKERRKRWKHRETRKIRMETDRNGMQRNGLYRTTVTPMLNIDPLRAAVHLQGRHVVGKRKVPLVDELKEWRQSEIAASRAREAAEKAAEKARQAEFDAARRELEAEIEEMKRKAASGKAIPPPKKPPLHSKNKTKNKNKRKGSGASSAGKDPYAEIKDDVTDALANGGTVLPQENEEDLRIYLTRAAARDEAADQLRRNAVVIPRTPDGIKLRPWFSYVKGVKEEMQRQSSLLRPTESKLSESLEALHKLEAENKQYKARVRRLDHDLSTQQAENKVVTANAKIVREKTGIKIREQDSHIQRLQKQLEKDAREASHREEELVREKETSRAAAKRKIQELTGELVGAKRNARAGGQEAEGLRTELQKQQQRSDASAHRAESLDKELKMARTTIEKHVATIAKGAKDLAGSRDESVVLRVETEDLQRRLAASQEAHKIAKRNATLKEKDLRREIKTIRAESQKALEGQATRFKRDSSVMRSKVTHVELVLDNADKRHMNTEGSIRGQLNTERKERGEREEAHASQVKVLKDRAEELRKERDTSNEEVRVLSHRFQTLEEELRAQIAAAGEVEARKVALVHAEKEQVRRELEEIISSKERQLRTVRGKLTVVKARVSDMNSHLVEEKEANDNELLRLQTWCKTLEQRLGDAETAREQESTTLRTLVETHEAKATESEGAATIQIKLMRAEVDKIRGELTAADARLAERTTELTSSCAEAEARCAELVAENDAASARASELVTTFQTQELAWKSDERALRRKIEKLECEKSDALALKNMSALDKELMEVRADLADARAEVSRANLEEAQARNERAEAAAELVLLQDRYEADIGDRNNQISRIKRGQDALKMTAFAAKNAQEASDGERVKIQSKLDDRDFELSRLRATTAGERERLQEELSLAERSIKSLQAQLENFHSDSAVGRRRK